MKRWTIIFKALGNNSRLKIIKLLSNFQPLIVGEISERIGISFRGTSQHLIILHNLDVLESEGKDGHVYYSINRKMPKDIARIVDFFLKSQVIQF